jgi:putative transposase
MNTVRLWGTRKPRVLKNTRPINANTMGFYAWNGNSVMMSSKESKAENFSAFLEEVRRHNDTQDPVIVILDNAKIHKSGAANSTANRLGISMVYLPPYSPHLNPIEQVWKSIKRELSPHLFFDREEMKEMIREAFYRLTKSTGYAKKWIQKILAELSKKLRQ